MERALCARRWEGEGLNEVGKDKSTGIVRVTVNPKYFRPTEVVRGLNVAVAQETTIRLF